VTPAFAACAVIAPGRRPSIGPAGRECGRVPARPAAYPASGAVRAETDVTHKATITVALHVEHDPLTLAQGAEDAARKRSRPQEDLASVGVEDDHSVAGLGIVDLDDSLHLDLFDLPRLQAGRADPCPAGVAPVPDPDTLDIGEPPPAAATVRVAHLLAHPGALATDLTTNGHVERSFSGTG
jgi:hypothetical protein